jgi:hypothetical protein
MYCVERQNTNFDENYGNFVEVARFPTKVEAANYILEVAKTYLPYRIVQGNRAWYNLGDFVNKYGNRES